MAARSTGRRHGLRHLPRPDTDNLRIVSPALRIIAPPLRPCLEPLLSSAASSDKFHDRFLIIDKAILIHVGASLNHLGKKCFASELATIPQVSGDSIRFLK